MSAAIDINSDLGEGFGQWTMSDDVAMLDIVTSANIACGFHAGDPSTMRKVCEAAVARGVTIGAHVSYPDLAGFGRRYIDIDPGELRDAVSYQLGALAGFAAAAGTYVCYVKPHGALYNTIVRHEVQAQAVIDGVACIADLPIVGLAGSAVLRLAAEAGLRPVTEAFVDRAYNPDGTLVPRSHHGAVLHDIDEIASRTVRMVIDGVVTAIDGQVVGISAESMCVHGDTPGAVAIAAGVRRALEAAGVDVRPFMP